MQQPLVKQIICQLIFPYEASYATGQRLAGVHMGAHHPSEKVLTIISAGLKNAMNIILINIKYCYVLQAIL